MRSGFTNIKLLQLQRSGLISITKCCKTVSTDAIQILAGIPPIDLKLQLSKELYNFKNYNGQLTVQNINFHNHALSQDPPLIPRGIKNLLNETTIEIILLVH
ncbi:hypothetical protein CDAR_276581 [Caerostris darwini]|uniref:Uncharacterized protein n=1 Tax=Caerostris darwini TaxID=1538125 RepID=A0AAV4N038_9ARAC|nr:hypothetical protein CDAR_276581 [Caerostris darwini]